MFADNLTYRYCKWCRCSDIENEIAQTVMVVLEGCNTSDGNVCSNCLETWSNFFNENTRWTALFSILFGWEYRCTLKDGPHIQVAST